MYQVKLNSSHTMHHPRRLVSHDTRWKRPLILAYPYKQYSKPQTLERTYKSNSILSTTHRHQLLIHNLGFLKNIRSSKRIG